MKNIASKLLLIGILLLSSLAGLYSSDKVVARLDFPSHELAVSLYESNYNVAAYHPGEWIDLTLSTEEYERLVTEGFNLRVVQTAESIKRNLRSSTERLDGYRFYEQTIQELHDLAEQHPDIIRLENIGKTQGSIYFEEGKLPYEDYQHNLWALKLTTKPDDISDKPAVYYMGAHHAREPLSTEVAMGVLYHLVEGYYEDEEIEDLIDKTEIWFIPIVNPDGQKVVLDEINLDWRKNIRDNNDNGQLDTMFDTDGVDLNRNYPFEWAKEISPSSLTYPGPFPASEPETTSVINLLRRENFVAGISYHTYSELVLYPYAYEAAIDAPDKTALKDLAEKMANTIPKLYSNGNYVPMQSSGLYPANGILDDFAYGELGIFAYTVELGVEFIPPAGEVEKIVNDNIEAAMVLLRRPHHTILKGRVVDSKTGRPIQAEIFVKGVDDTGVFREPYQSAVLNGKFRRILAPNTYDIVVSAYGFYEETVENVVIKDGEVTNLEVGLTPFSKCNIEGVVLDGVTQLPIPNVHFEIPETLFDTATSDEDGNYQLKDVFYGAYEMVVTAEGYGTHWEIIRVNDPNLTCDLYLFPAQIAESFDNADSWKLDEPWGLDNNYAYIGENSLCTAPGANYPSNMKGYATFLETIDLTNAYNASFTFRTRHRLEKDFDFCYLQMSLNGNTWYPMDTFTGIQDDWILKEYKLNSYLAQKVQIRLFFRSDIMNTDEGFYIDDLRAYVSTPVESSVHKNQVKPLITQLRNYPNPFNAETFINFSISEPQIIELDVYNVMGQKVRSLAKEELSSGEHTIVWDGRNEKGIIVGNGIYLYRLKTNNQSTSKRMILLK